MRKIICLLIIIGFQLSLFAAGKMAEFNKIKKIKNIKFLRAIGGNGSIPGKFLFPTAVLILDGKPDYLGKGFDEILVVDKNNNRIQKFDSSYDFEYSFGSFGKGEFQFNSPWSIAAWTKNYIYISDTLNHRIVHYDIKGNFVGLLNFLPSKAETLNIDKLRLNEPKGIDIDSAGNIYIADSGNDRIIKISSTGYFLSEIKGVEFEAEYFSRPSDVKVDNSGNLYIADTGNNRVILLNNWLNVILKIEKLAQPQGISTDNEGNIFISDTGNNKVVVYNIRAEFIEDIEYKFNKPIGIAISQEKKTEKGEIFRNLYIADSGNHQVLLFRIEYGR